MQTFSLEDDTTYDCLSYTWGSTDDLLSIQVKGNFYMQVTHNLFAALRRFRAHGEGMKVGLWVDAVCINQRDVEERSRMVAMMGKIYSSARRVMIWLDDWPDTVPETWRRCHAFTGDGRDYAGSHWKQDMSDLGILADDGADMDFTKALFAVKGCDPSLHAAWLMRIHAGQSDNACARLAEPVAVEKA